MTLKRLIFSCLCCVLLSSVTVSAATITVTGAHISPDFSTFSATSDISGFVNTGDIAHFTAIVGLQSLLNGEEAITFAPITSFPSAGQSIPDHSVPPFPPGSSGRTINIVSAILDFTLNTFSVAGVLQGQWTSSVGSDYTIIVGLQNSDNGEEAITFAEGVEVSAPSTLGAFAMALVVLSLYRRHNTVQRA